MHVLTTHKMMEETQPEEEVTGAFEFTLESLNMAIHTWELSNFIK